jgi:hypothetical protein
MKGEGEHAEHGERYARKLAPVNANDQEWDQERAQEWPEGQR